MKVAIVTGGSSGIGLGTVKALIHKGCSVYVLSRKEFAYPGAEHRSVDVTDEEAVSEVIRGIYEAAGRIDILVNCAGFGISGAVEFTELAAAKKQFDVNFFGTVNVTKAVLPYMRKQGNGRICNISSVAALAPIPFQAYYSASKSAINTYTGSLANEVRPFGITVTAIMPGDIKTGFTAAREKSPAGDAEYAGRIARSVRKMEHDEQNGMDADFAGSYIAKLALKKRVKPLYSIGFSYKFLSVLCMLLPSRVKSFILWKLYG